MATTTEPAAPTAEALAFIRDRRVARLATVGDDGKPTVVPICYALIEHHGEPVVVSALDQKPKRVPVERLRRVRHIAAHPDVSLVVDDYAEEWSRLAFAQVHGRARLCTPSEPGHAVAIAALRAKYSQYASMAIDENPMIWIDDLRTTFWRAGGSPDELAMRPTELMAIMQGRRSVRAFVERPAPRAIIERAIAAAGWAPSPHGRQPWRFVVVEARERRTALADAMAQTWQDQLELDGQDETIVQIRLAKSRERLLTASALIVPCLYLADLDVYPDAERQVAETTMAIQSLGAAVQNLLLTVYAEGLDAGWMCAPLFCPDIVRESLELDPRLTPHAILPIGYAAKDPVRRDRLSLDRLIVSWE